MSNMVAKTKKGTELPLINLKGKQYLQVAYRLLWLTETYDRYNIESTILKAEKDESIVRVVVSLFDDTGVLVRQATASKREDSKGFADNHLEKAETGALGRALAMLGFGTQFTTQDLDEGERLADSPVMTKTVAAVSAASVVPVATPTAPAASVATPAESTATTAKVSSFRRSTSKVNTTKTASTESLSPVEPDALNEEEWA